MASEPFPSWSKYDGQFSIPTKILIKFSLFQNIYGCQLLRKSQYKLNENYGPYLARQAFHVIWELYQDNHQLLNDIITALVVPGRSDESYPQVLKKTDPLMVLLYPFGCNTTDKLAQDSWLLNRLHQDIQNCIPTLLNADSAHLVASCRLSHSALDYSPLGFHCRTLNAAEHLEQLSNLYMSPKMDAISQRLKEMLQDCRTEIDRTIKQFVTSHLVQIGDSAPSQRRLDQKPISSPRLLFAPSGSGKTTRVLQHLMNEFGFYFQACNTVSHAHDHSKIHSPKRSPGSKDTLSMMELVNYAQSWTPLIPGMANSEWVREKVATTIDCRVEIFTRFMDIAKEVISASVKYLRSSPGLNAMETPLTQDEQTVAQKGTLEGRLPHLWLLIQIGNASDPFDELFKITTLFNWPYNPFSGRDYVALHKQMSSEDIPNLQPGPVSAIVRNLGEARSVYYCLDEAQADLDVLLQNQAGETVPLLGIWYNMLIGQTWEEVELFNPETDVAGTVVLSGTSLKVRELTAALLTRESDVIGEASFKDSSLDEIVVDDFDLITEDLFKSMMKAKGIDTAINQHYPRNTTDIQHRIILCGRLLFGRPLWSSIYLEAVQQVLVENQTLEHIKQAADNTVRRVKADLLKRLQLFDGLRSGQNGVQYDRLLKDICRVVLDCLFLDQSTAFIDERDHELISQALGVMLPDSTGIRKVHFAERLVLEVAIEYFEKENQAVCEEVMKQQIQAHTHNMCALGFAAEPFLVWNLSRILKTDSNRLLGSPNLGRLSQVLTLFGTARYLNQYDPGNTYKLQLDHYSIVEGSNLGYMYSTQNRQELSDWMNAVGRRQMPYSTFYLPDTRAGPDVIFALQSPRGRADGTSADIVVCAVQLKVGDVDNHNKAIETTDFNLAYTNRKEGTPLKDKAWRDRYDAVHKEVKHWSQNGVRILRIFVTAALPNTIGVRADAVIGSDCHEYYLRCDESKTELLFGPDFDNLLNATRRAQAINMSDQLRRAIGMTGPSAYGS